MSSYANPFLLLDILAKVDEEDDTNGNVKDIPIRFDELMARQVELQTLLAALSD